MSIAIIKEWLKNKTINFVGLYRKSKEHYVHQSFVITVTNETYHKVFDEALWPSGVTVREYAPPPPSDKMDNTLKVISYNCKGLTVSKVPCIEHLLLQCDVLLLEETWLFTNEFQVISK